jgi:GR25 family glycosyltransferase involved in LPS biosynthesis
MKIKVIWPLIFFISFIIVISIIVWYYWFRIIKKILPLPLTEQSVKKYKGNDIPLFSLCTQNTKRCNKPAGSHRCCIDHLATMLEALTDHLGPKIFILYGTALACKRYNGKYMIPHDDYLDTGILAEDEELLKEAIPKLEKKGFVFNIRKNITNGKGPVPSCNDSKNCPIIKYPSYRYYDMNYSKKNHLHLDIALLTSSKLKNGLQVLVDAPQKWAKLIPTMSMEEVEKYKSWILPQNDILPVKSTTYLGMTVYCPNNIDNHLKNLYGPNYMVPYDRDKNGGNKEPINRLINNIKYNYEDIGMGPILIVNLDKDVERLHHLLTQCEEEGLYAKKIGNCCDEELTKKDKDRFKYNNKLHRNLGSGEMKCFLSHEMCWVEASKQNIPSLIVEDDISFPFNFKSILVRILQELKILIDSGVIPVATTIRLGISNYDHNYSIISQLNNTCFATSNFNTGTWAYIVTPEAAKILLKISNMNNLLWPVDHFVNPPYNRDSYENYETRIPDNNEYICLEIFKDVFEPIEYRYNLNIDKSRYQIIQELSTEFNNSRSSIK